MYLLLQAASLTGTQLLVEEFLCLYSLLKKVEEQTNSEDNVVLTHGNSGQFSDDGPSLSVNQVATGPPTL